MGLSKNQSSLIHFLDVLIPMLLSIDYFVVSLETSPVSRSGGKSYWQKRLVKMAKAKREKAKRKRGDSSSIFLKEFSFSFVDTVQIHPRSWPEHLLLPFSNRSL